MKTADRLLSKALDFGECLISEKKNCENRYPFVFVHGLLGWGERDAINAVLPYWGLTGGHLLPFLRESGAQCCAASVGPLSSCWDRACELYAQLTGSTTDYGVAHSAKYDHARFGKTYDEPLIEGWSEDKKINLIGHSFGGATARLFLDILAEGRPEEVEAARAQGREPSPFFEGGKAGLVHSITAIAAPHNGTTFFEANPNAAAVVKTAFVASAKALGIAQLKGVYDFQLDQFGICKAEGESLSDTAARVLGSDALTKGDSAYRDLTVDASLEMNASIPMQEGVYYFSYPCSKTIVGLVSYGHRPCLGMSPVLKSFASGMGSYYDKKTEGGFLIGRDWAENDGLVNTVSEQYPTDKNGRCLTKTGGEGFVIQDREDLTGVKPGVWNVMPTINRDHFAVIGGVPNAGPVRTRMLYRQIIDNIIETEQ